MSDARSYRATVERVEAHTPATRSLFLRLAPGHGLPFRAGQFVSVSIPTGEKPLSRAYTIASPQGQAEVLEICLDLVAGGPGSSYLFDLAVGASVGFTGPWGTFILGDPPPQAAVLIAIGTGIAALRPMAHAALAGSTLQDLHLLYAGVDVPSLLYRDELERLAQRDPRFRFEPFLEGGDTDHAALHALVERRWVSGEADRQRHFFVCGVGAIVTRVRDLLRGAGYERRAVHYEKW